MPNIDDPIHRDEVMQLLEGSDKVDAIYKIVKDLQERSDKQYKLLTQIAVAVSKLYVEGKMNKDTFNKLDEFLRDYYENSCKDE